MTALQHQDSVVRKSIAGESGQAALEFAVIASLGLIFVFALIDFGRALNYLQVMVGLTREGSNTAARGDSLLQSAKSVLAGDAPLDLAHHGEVIVTSITNKNQVNTITGQVSQGGVSFSSKVGQGVGNPATVSPAAAAMLQPGQTIYVTEVFYTYQPITPLGNFVSIVMPSTLYEVAYF